MPFVPQGKLDLESNMKSRNRGAGGFVALRHNPLEPILPPNEINGVFWTCLEHRDRSLEKWMSAPQFARSPLSRYHEAVLLQDVRLDA